MSLLDLRNNQKKKKPTFIRQDAHKIKRLGQKWRKPKGLQSKMRLSKKSYPTTVKPGYGSPCAVRGMTRDGLFPVDIANVADLAKVEKGMVGIIKRSVGNRKRAMIIKAALEKKVALTNGSEERVSKIEAGMKERQEAKKKKSAKKVEVAKEDTEEKAKPAEKKEEATEEKTKPSEKTEEIDDKKKADKKEKDKLLIKKGAI